MLLDDLDVDQRRAVTTESRLVAVIAPAGSGKTRVLTRRVAYRVAAGSAHPRHTLVLTFTREAAGELRRRLPRLGLRDQIEAGTFHAVMLGLLRQRWSDRNRPIPAVVTDRRRLVVAGSGERGLDELVAEIDWAAARGISPERYGEHARRHGRRPRIGHTRVAEGYDRYRRTKRERGVIDLDDVLSLAVDAMVDDEEFAEGLAWRFRHILVDEAQDLNPLQHRIVELLRHRNDDLFVVGDPSQAVYGFNGADPSLLVDVAERFPGIEIVRLMVNHRSTPQVVGAGRHVLRTRAVADQHSTVMADVTSDVRSGRPDGPPVRIVSCPDEMAEAATVATFATGLDPGVLAGGSVAVLARTHAQLEPLRAALAEAGVEVRQRLDGAGSPYRDTIAAASRAGSGSALRSWAHELLAGEQDSPDAARRSPPVPETSREVALAALEFLREHPHGDGSGFRTWIVATDPFDTRRTRGVELLTFHAAKGREWHTVVVTGAETGLVPHRSATTVLDRAEEARLLHVALTRATDQLVVTWARRRGGYRRHLTPLLDGFEPPAVEVVSPPTELLTSTSPAALEHRRVVARRLEVLTAWRDRTARAAGVLPEHVLDTDALRRLAHAPPAGVDELVETTGIGPLTATRLLPGLRRALDDAESQPESSPAGPHSRRSTSTGA